MGNAGVGYYITDVQNHYYRLNDAQELVVTEAAEAAVFSHEEAVQRIGDGRKASFYRIIPAIRQEEEQFPFNIAELDWQEYLEYFIFLVSVSDEYLDELNGRLSDVDMEICDIMHRVELYDVQEAECASIVQLLQECRVARREIKDEALCVEWFRKALGTKDNLAHAGEMLKQIKKLDTRKYTPRRLHALFEDAEVRTVTEQPSAENIAYLESYKGKKREQVPAEATEGMQHIQMQEEQRMEADNSRMDYVERATVYDRQPRDWMAYARSQADFFADARQHMMNLYIELERTEQEIEEILHVIEDANYNVTQGYRVFKELKDLRNHRKNLQQEIKCLELLTAQFDCEAMLGAYQYCVEQMSGIIGASVDASDEGEATLVG